jgi:hypothetical protein
MANRTVASASSTGHAMLRHALGIELRVDEVALRDPLRDNGLGAGEIAQELLDLLCHLLHHGQILALDLDSHGRLDSGVLHHHASADRLRPAVDVADDLHRVVHLGDQLLLGHARPPLRLRLEHHGGLDHLDGRRVGRRVRASELAEHASHLGEGLQLAVHLLHDPPRLARGQTGQRRRHVEDRAFVHLRHVVLLEPEHDDGAGNEDYGAGADEGVAVPDHPQQDHAVAAHEDALANVGRHHIAFEHPDDDDRQQEQRQQRRECHRERLAVGQRIEQPPLALAEEEDRQERRHDDEHREEQRLGHRGGGVDDRRHLFASRDFAALCQPRRAVLDDDDRGIGHLADGNRQTPPARTD